MKKLIITVAALAISTSMAFADVTREDIRKLAAAGCSDDVIIAFIKANSPAPKLSADDVIDLKKSGVSDKVVQAMMSAEGVSPRVLDRGGAGGGGGGQQTVVVQQQPVYVERYVPSTTYVYVPSYSYSYSSCRPYYYSYSSCSPSYYSSCGGNYYYSSCNSYPRWGFSYSSGSCRRGWGVSVRW